MIFFSARAARYDAQASARTVLCWLKHARPARLLMLAPFADYRHWRHFDATPSLLFSPRRLIARVH